MSFVHSLFLSLFSSSVVSSDWDAKVIGQQYKLPVVLFVIVRIDFQIRVPLFRHAQVQPPSHAPPHAQVRQDRGDQGGRPAQLRVSHRRAHAERGVQQGQLRRLLLHGQGRSDQMLRQERQARAQGGGERQRADLGRTQGELGLPERVQTPINLGLCSGERLRQQYFGPSLASVKIMLSLTRN